MGRGGPEASARDGSLEADRPLSARSGQPGCDPMTQGTHRPARAAGRAAWAALFVVGILLVPRALRLSAPHVNIEDDNYLYSAYLIHRGEVPYRDFVQANPPLLEQLTAPFFALFGATYRVGEGLSAVAVLASALALFLLGRRLYGAAAGLWAAALYSWAPLVFRYHLFEREVFSLAAAALGLAVALCGGPRRRGARSFVGGALCGVAFHFKQVGVFPGAALVLYLLALRQWRLALHAAAGLLAVSAGLLAVSLASYGPDVGLQSFALHLIKGAPLPFEVRIVRMLAELGALLPVAALGALLRRPARPALLLGLWAALELAFMLGISSTFWPHYMVPLLGPLCLFAGAAFTAARRRARLAAGAALVCALAVVAVQARSSPLQRLGFGGVSRLELQAAAEQIAEAVPPGSRALLCPPVLALQADRIKLYNYIDTLGFTRQLQQAWQAGTLLERLRRRQHESFSGTLARANAAWVPEALERLRAHEVLAVVPEGELPIRPPVLLSLGYRPIFDGRWFDVYVPERLAASGGGGGR
jgi:hypothetical protein